MKHPNRLPFEGVLTIVDEPSDLAPRGSRGHRVVVTRKAAEAALSSLVGMGLNCSPDWDAHDVRQKIGVISDADVVGNELRVFGYIFAKDFPELADEIRKRPLGMSYEVADGYVEDMHASIWVIRKVTFTGAAVLLGSMAAYRKSRFRLLSRGDGQRRSLVPESRAVSLQAVWH